MADWTIRRPRRVDGSIWMGGEPPNDSTPTWDEGVESGQVDPETPFDQATPAPSKPGGGAATTAPPATSAQTNPSPVTSTGQIAPYSPTAAGASPLTPFNSSYDWKPEIKIPPGMYEAEGEQLAALRKALTEGMWTPENVAGMKEIQKEQALSMAGQLGEDVNQRFAGMGRVPSGARQAALGDIDSETMAQILSAYRDIDLATREQNANYLLSTSGALDQALGGQFGRQYQLGTFGEQQREFDLAHFLAALEYMEKQRQFNEDLGFRYGALNAGLALG